MTNDETPTRTSSSPSLFVSASIIVLLAFAFLGTRPLWDPDEGRYTNVALNMLESGDWIHPMRSEHVGHWTKPPLTYWAIAASVGTFGYNPWAARLPNALAFLICAWMVWRIARRLIPDEENKAALIYATMFLPFGAAQLVTTDFLLSASLSMAMMAWVESRFDDPQRSRRWVLLMWVGFGLGFLIKGPPALLPLLAVIAVIRLLPAPRAAAVFHWSSLLVFAAVAMPWYLSVIRDTDGLLDYFLGSELVDRIATSKSGRHSEWYGWLEIYAPTLLVGSLPWSFPLWRWLRSLGTSLKLWRNKQTRFDDPVGLILFLWLVVPLLIFCVARSRLPLYVLPLFTPLALIIARQLRLDGRRFPKLTLIAVWVFLLVAIRLASTFWPTHKNAEEWAVAIRDRVPYAVHEVLFIEDMARYGIHLHLGAQVEKISLEPLDEKSLNPVYDSDLETELLKADPNVIYVTRQARWPDLQQRIKASGREARLLGTTFQDRVIFSVAPPGS